MFIMEETILRLYDKEMKNILSYPSLVAPILHYCIDELKDMSIAEIIESIEKVPNTEEKIQKLDGELFTLKRRVPLRADSIFQIRIAKQRYKVNLEPQVEEPKTYSIFDRQEMYSAILLTEQEEDGQGYQNYMPIYSIWLIFVKNLKESRIGRTKNTIEWYNGKKRRVEERRSLMNGVFVYIGEDAKNSEGLFSYLYALFQSADPKRREKEFEKYGIERREEVEEVDQVYWDILKQSVQIESERMAEQMAEQMAKPMAENLAAKMAQQMTKEEKLKEAVRLVNQLLKTGTMSFEQIFSIVTNGYSKEEKASVLAAFQSIA